MPPIKHLKIYTAGRSSPCAPPYLNLSVFALYRQVVAAGLHRRLKIIYADMLMRRQKLPLTQCVREDISDIKDIKSNFTVSLVRHTLLTLGLCYLHHKDHSNKHGGARHHRAQEQCRDIGLPALQEKPYFIGAAVCKPLDKPMI